MDENDDIEPPKGFGEEFNYQQFYDPGVSQVKPQKVSY